MAGKQAVGKQGGGKAAAGVQALDRAALLALARPSVKLLQLEGLGTVGIRKMTIRDQKAWADKTLQLPPERQDESIALLLMATLVNPDGTLMFEDGDIDVVNGLDRDVVQQLFAEIKAHNSLGVAELEAATKN
jgi:hypothetical protein